MSQMNYQKLSLWIGVIIIVLGGCTEKKFDWVYHEMEVIVVDEQGFPIRDAEVKLYRTETDFKEGREPLEEGYFTDSDGSIVFDKLPLDFTEYYVEAVKGEANNWGKNPKVSNFQQFERKKKVVYLETKALVNYLAGRSEKRWELEYTIINTTPYNGCEVYTFQRNQELYYSLYDIDADCFPEHREGDQQFWDLNEIGNSFQIFGTSQGGGLVEDAQILEMTDETLIYRYKPADNPDAPWYITRKLRLAQ